MNITQISNPRWANAEHTQIDCEITLVDGRTLPYTADANDVVEHSRQIFARCVDGEAGPIAEYVAPPVVEPQPPRPPSVVTMRQARLALLQAGLLTQVESAIQQAGIAAQIEWEYATELHRTHSLTQSLSVALGISSEQLDALFMQAAAL